MWKKADIPTSAQRLQQEGYSRLTALVIANAGVENKEQAEEFLHSETVHNPAKIRNIEKVSEIIWDHIYRKEKICVFGDYDCDGVTGAAILYLMLKRLGADVMARLPDRIYEGYGISMEAIREEIALGTKLFITVDNGIKAIAEIEEIRRQGCKSIVLDHHQPGEVLPDADALVDLWIEGETYPFHELTGSGLAWKVACYMLTLVDDYDYAMELVDLAAFGTIADVAPLIGENRSIVKRALRQMRSCWYKREGVKALYDGPLDRITAEDIAFKIAPCINASGRLDVRGADLPLLLLLEDRPGIAEFLAERLTDCNNRRKSIQKEWCNRMEETALKMIEQGDKVLVLLADGAPSGVVGLVAGNLKEKYNRPTIVFAPKQDSSGKTVWTGSGRSIKGFHLLNALKTCEDFFLAYGGHELAAGMSIPENEEVLSQLRTRLNQVAEYLSETDLMPMTYWDTEITEAELTNSLYEELKSLEPFGEGVKKPVFKMRMHLLPKRHMLMGADKSHLKLFCENYSAVGFSLADKYIHSELPEVIDALGYPCENYFNGKVKQEFMVRITNHNAGLLRNNLSDDKSLQTRQLRERLERLNLLLRTSFESYISGVISEEDYLFNKSKYEAEIKSCEEHMDLVAVKEKTIDVEGVRRNPYIVSLKKFSRARVLTREMCIALIDRIEIDEENAITIYPKYRDEFSALYEMIEEKERENE